jgi:dienelactone hydrolase
VRVPWIYCAALALLVVASAAAGGEAAGSAASAVQVGAGRPVLQPLTKRCLNQPDGNAKPFWFRATDGALLDGAVLGHGDVGILLTPELGGDVCQWLSFSVFLSQRGYLVLLFDSRGQGLSPSPTSQPVGRVDADVEAGVRELRRRGAKRIVLGGASVGASAVLTAAASIKPAVAGVVSLSPLSTETLTDYATQYAQLNPDVAVTHLQMPVLYVTTRYDNGDLALANARKLYARTRSAGKRLVVLGGSSHGTDMLLPGLGKTRVQNLMLDFIQKSTRG